MESVKKLLGLMLFAGLALSGTAQQLLTLDSCRAMALRNNKQMGVSKLKQEVAHNLRKSARTKYLPHVRALGAYEYTSREVSLLSQDQKAVLSSLGTNAVGGLQNALQQLGSQLPANQVTATVGQMISGLGTQTAGLLDAGGQYIVDALRTDTRNLWVGQVLVTQPVFMGGSIVAMNKMADLNEQMAENTATVKEQQTIYDIDKAYWQVVSLKHKKALAESYLSLVRKLSDDVNKMIEEGVATRSEGLSVEVKENEAEMTVTKVSDGLVLSKMLLCQLCGLPLDSQVTLADEDNANLSVPVIDSKVDVQQAVGQRPEVKMLQNVADMAHQTTNILKAGNLPQVLLTGGYAISNPNLLNGFEKKFGGFWNVGVLVRVPIWNWGDVTYKVRAAKGATAIANLELAEAREKIELQVQQSSYQMEEANKRLALAKTSIKRADENLRTANLGFQEGVITPTTVMEAQTAWLQAKSQEIDAEIDVRLSQVNFKKATGTLYAE